MNTLIQTVTPKLETSLDFYQKLGFKLLNENTVSDGLVAVQIATERTMRSGLVMYSESWEAVCKELEKITQVIKIDNGYLLADPSNSWIYLLHGEAPVGFTLEERSFSVLGNFAGVSLESIDIGKSKAIYEILGFVKEMGSIEQGWASFKNKDGMGLSLMAPNSCPHLFFNPSLTYFNGGKNLPVIEKIKNLGIEIAEEITVFNDQGIVDNIIIRDPGGFGFFIFND